MIRINADDFGLHADINRGILHSVERGLVNSVSIVANGEAANPEQIWLLLEVKQKNPRLDLGIHLALTEGKALSGISTLTDSQGHFPPYVNDFAKRFLWGKVSLYDVRREWTQQIETLRKMGVALTHLDSHQHVHLLPGLWALAGDLAKAHGIPVIRTSYESLGGALGKGNPRFIVYQLLAGWRYWTSHGATRTLGVLCSMDFSLFQIEKKLESRLKKKQPCEIMVHPAKLTKSLQEKFGFWGAKWEGEAVELEKLKRYLEGWKAPASVHSDVMALYSGLSKSSRFFIEGRALLCPFAFVEKMLPPKGVFLDLGCGHGYFSLYLALSSKERSVSGIDADPDKMRLVDSLKPGFPEELARRLSLNLKTLKDLPQDRSFDGICVLDVLYQIPHEIQEDILRDIFRRLKPGGVLVLKETHHFFHPVFWVAYLEECLMVSLRSKRPRFRFFYRSRKGWEVLLQKIGFSNISSFKTPREKINNHSHIYRCEKSPPSGG